MQVNGVIAENLNQLIVFFRKTQTRPSYMAQGGPRHCELKRRKVRKREAIPYQ